MAKEKKITLKQLSEADREKLFKQFEAQKIEKEKKQAKGRADYKDLVDATIIKVLPQIQEVSNRLAEVKNKVIDSFQSLIKLKSELYDKETDQSSHSFTTKDGKITIIVGYNQIDGWDDTVETGIEKVKDYISSLAKDKESKALVDAVLKLLSKDKSGSLKASRVLNLKQMADNSGDAAFIDAVKIIQEAYRPKRSKDFIRAIITDGSGAKQVIPLSITDASLK